MTIEEMRERKRALDGRLSSMIEEFERETGCAVSAVDFSRVTYSNVSDASVPVCNIVVVL